MRAEPRRAKLSSYVWRVMAGALEGDLFVGPKAQEHRGLLRSANQCCGTVAIYYGSGSDFCQVMVPAPAPYLDHKKQ